MMADFMSSRGSDKVQPEGVVSLWRAASLRVGPLLAAAYL